MKVKNSIILVLAGLLTMLFMAVAQGQEDIETLTGGEAFASHSRPAAVFMHDEHNEKAGVDECSTCHHVYEDGKLMEDEDSVGTACAECHTLAAQGSQPGLMVAYHRQCKSCHVEQAKGPVACGQCHVKP